MHFKRQLQLFSLLTGLCFAQGGLFLPGKGGTFAAAELRLESSLSEDMSSGGQLLSLHESAAYQHEDKLAGSMVQIGVVSDATQAPRSVDIENPDRAENRVIFNDRGDPLVEPRLDAPAESAQTLETTVLRPDYKDLWTRMRAGFALPALDSPLVQKHIQYYTYKPEYLERMFERGSRYLFYIVEEIERRGMPGELALLPFVESAMNPTAMSPAKAAGLWQFIPSTGKAYNLSQNWWVDNRRDPVHSTQAALEYLQRIYELQGNDWFLALASYNWGEGAVGKAMRRNQASGRPTDYLSLNMPQETRHYVPKLMALREIVLNPALFNVRLPSLPNKPYFVEVEAPLHLDLKLAARFAGLTEEEFVSLNPAHNRPVIAARTNDQIKIPADRVDSFLAAMKAHETANKPFSRWRPYTLEQGESIQSLASRLGTSAQEIMRANGLRTAKVLPGTRLLVPAPDDKSTALTVMTSFDGPRILEKVQRPAIYHRVGKKETTESIARRYGVTAASLQAWNNLKHEVKLGMRLLVKPASAQTVLTNESGVSKVIATEVVTPKQFPDVSKDAAKPQEDAVKSKVNPKSGVGNKQTEPPKVKPAKDQKQQLVEQNKAVKTSTQASTKALPQASKPSTQATTSAGKKTGDVSQSASDKAAKPKAKPDIKADPDASPKSAPRVTASYQSASNLGLL